MDDLTNPDAQEAPEVEALPEAELEEQDTPETEPELDDDGNPIEGPDGQADAEPEPGLAEVEIDGKTYKLPPELKDGFLRQADYTRKTQEVAEIRKAAEATLQAVTTVTQVERQAEVAIAVIDMQIADYQSIDWDAWEESDPVAANREWRKYTQIKDARQAAVAQHQQASQQRTLIQQQETARLLEQGQRELAAKIPNWNRETAAKLAEHASANYGFRAEELNGITDPRMIQVLNDAYQFRQASKTQQAVKKAEVQQAIKPAAKIAPGKPPARGLDDRLPTKAWIEARNRQVANRNR
jgi:hypothetical protein